MRREPLHPGAQRSLFPSLEYRYWGFYTDQDGDPVDLDVTMRAHAHVEQHIERLKDSGLVPLPLHQTSRPTRTGWRSCMLAADLVRWFQLLCFDGLLARCPTQGAALGHLPCTRAARLIGTAPRSCASSTAGPSADALLGAYRRIELIT